MQILLFKDNDRTYPVDTTGFNKLGIVTSDKSVVFPYKRKVLRKTLTEITKLPCELRHIEHDIEPRKIDTFFLENFQSPDLFNSGVHSITNGDSEYFDNPIKLPMLKKGNLLNKEQEWKKLCELIEVGDWLCTYDRKGITSKIISKIDSGPWSHVGMCSGKGTIVEAITKGVVERPLSVYAGDNYHVGLYRYVGSEKEEAVSFMRSQIGKKYNFKGAYIAGTQKLFKKLRHAPTPADLIINSKAELITFV
jgi:hypothetical protein